MSIEGMWAFVTGSNENPGDMRDGGIVVLETGRVFGGDSAMAYVGQFELSGTSFQAKVNSWMWNTLHIEAGTENVFGMSGDINIKVVVEGEFKDDQIRGYVWPEDHPGMRVAAMMKKITDLP